MNHKLLRTSVLTIGLLTVSSTVFAHHGNSVYDLKKTTTLSGTITTFEWDNPHCLIHIDVKADNGEVQHWTLELPSPFMMNRKGWTKDSLKPGDQCDGEHPSCEKWHYRRDQREQREQRRDHEGRCEWEGASTVSLPLFSSSSHSSSSRQIGRTILLTLD
jgi:Family of unknown function (DUF6152)